MPKPFSDFKILPISFFNLFDLYISNIQKDKMTLSDIDGNLTQYELEKNGYDAIAEEPNFLYEKIYILRHFRRYRHIRFKHYYLSDDASGDGVSVETGIRLISLLKHCINSANMAGASVEFYFLKDLKNGAAIFNNSVVVRFSQDGKRGAYYILGIESDAGASKEMKKLSVNGVKYTMCLFDLTVIKKSAPIALYKLATFVSKYLEQITGEKNKPPRLERMVEPISLHTF
jgi:hypothetical protein